MNGRVVRLAGVLLLAFFLRVLNLNRRAMWYDEAFAVLYAEKTFGQMWEGTVTLVQGAAADVHPLFFYTLLHGWMGLLGESPFAVRFFSAILSVLTVAVVYRLAHVLFSDAPKPALSVRRGMPRRAEDIALLAALAFAVSPFAIAYGQEARMYALLGFAAAVTVLAYLMIERGRGRGWWGVLIGGGAAMLYSHNLAVFFGAALALWIVSDAILHRAWRKLLTYVAAGLATLVLWLPWLWLIPSQMGKIQQAYWISQPDLVSVLQTLLTFTVDFDNARMPPVLLPFALAGMLLPVLLLLYEIGRGGWRDGRIGLLGVLVVVPPLLIIGVSLWRPVYLTRALMPSFVMLIILVAWLLVRLPAALAWGLRVGLGGLVLGSLFLYYSYADFPRAPFVETLNMVASAWRADDVIVHDNKLSYFPMYYYARGSPLPQHFVEDPQGSAGDTLALPTQQALNLYAEPLAAAVGTHARVWFVIFEQAQEESGGGANLDWMRNHYRLGGEWNFHDLQLVLFEK